MNQLTVFKIRIDSITETSVGFELFVGDHLRDSFINTVSTGSYSSKKRLSMPPQNFSDFAIRLIAYVYTTKVEFSDEQLKVLWGLKITIFDHEAQKLSKSVFQINSVRTKLFKLKLIK